MGGQWEWGSLPGSLRKDKSVRRRDSWRSVARCSGLGFLSLSSIPRERFDIFGLVSASWRAFLPQSFHLRRLARFGKRERERGHLSASSLALYFF